MQDAVLDEHGRPRPPLAGNEAATLVGFLEYQRATLAWKCGGLTDEQLRIGLAPTNMTLGGLLKHLARVEDSWFAQVVAHGDKPEPWASMAWAAEWGDDTHADLLRQSIDGETGE